MQKKSENVAHAEDGIRLRKLKNSGRLRNSPPTRSATRFLRVVADTKYSSALAIKYQKRFQKSGRKLFTFLDHDGIPWNNNNAEHAIKLFAKYRRNVDGYFTERSLQEYLVMATVFETCAFNNVNVLKFMLSKETPLEGLLKMAGRRPERHLARSSSHSDFSGVVENAQQ